MKALTLAAALATVLALPAAAQETYSLDARHTFPTFEVNHLGFSTQRGMFTKTTGKVTIDRAARKGSADITIDMSAITKGDAKLSDHLRAEDFFDVAKFPTATFKGSDFKFEGDKLVSVGGDLTLRGVTKPVTLAVAGFTCGAHPMNKKALCGADASVTIKRSDFGIKYALPAVGDNVKLSIPIEAFKD
jgi:polyisoprenoid-binding protein YceI